MLLSGDHVLPRISPAVTVHPQQRPSPLADFLDSLRKVADFDVDEVLPAHEYRFADLGARVEQLREHHDTRLADVLALVAAHPGVTAWEVAQRLTWAGRGRPSRRSCAAAPRVRRWRTCWSARPVAGSGSSAMRRPSAGTRLRTAPNAA